MNPTFRQKITEKGGGDQPTQGGRVFDIILYSSTSTCSRAYRWMCSSMTALRLRLGLSLSLFLHLSLPLEEPLLS